MVVGLRGVSVPRERELDGETWTSQKGSDPAHEQKATVVGFWAAGKSILGSRFLGRRARGGHDSLDGCVLVVMLAAGA